MKKFIDLLNQLVNIFGVKYEILGFVRGEAPTELTVTVLCATDNKEAYEKFIERAKSGPSVAGAFVPANRPGPKGRPLRVVAIEAGFEEPSSDFRPGELFNNAAEAAQALRSAGVFSGTYNPITVGLSNARKLGQTSATVHHVVFQYEDDYQAELNADVRVD